MPDDLHVGLTVLAGYLPTKCAHVLLGLQTLTGSIKLAKLMAVHTPLAGRAPRFTATTVTVSLTGSSTCRPTGGDPFAHERVVVARGR